MQRILIIEPSATLRRALTKQLQGAYGVEEADGYEAGLRRLADAPGDLQAVLFSWPAHSNPHTDDLLAVLGEAPLAGLPVAILAQDADATLLDWVSGRAHTALLSWEAFQESRASLDKLLGKAAQSGADRAPRVSGPDGEPIRILVVDDSPTVRAKLRRLLGRSGYHTVTAANVAEGLELARGEPIDIAIVDYFMPDATGDVLCHQLRADPRTAGITSAVLTSTYLDQVISESLAAGAVDCMFKNESDELFLARVAAMSRAVQSTKRIERERQRLQGILSSVGDGVYGVDGNGQVTFINPAALRLLGYDSQAALEGRAPQEIFHSDCPDLGECAGDECHLRQALEQGVPADNVETVFTRRDGTAIQVELTIHPLRIEGRMEGAVVAFRDVSVRKLLEEELKWQANHDPLTKLLNRKYFEDALEQEVRRLKRSNDDSALVYLDLDRFKYINDTVGHAAGDRLLVEIGRHLNSRLRESDLLARIGGDEFAIILRNVDKQSAFAVADEFRELLAGYNFNHDGRSYKINGSIGVELLHNATASPGEALANADIACHIAKGKGRNQTHLFEAGNDDKIAMDLELGWSSRLHTALEQDNFRLFYQPIVPLVALELDSLGAEQGAPWEQLAGAGQRQHPLGFEALLRLHDARGEPVSPNAFLPTAERFNLMPRIDRWVIRNAVEHLAGLHARGERAVLNINLSGQSLDDPALVEFLQEALRETALDPGCVVFEITETCAIANIDAAQRLIAALSARGCRFALDDFGSGYCSFAHLKNLAVDFIKIDGMFVQGIATDPMDRAIVSSINEIAHSLGKLTIAESVEDAETLRALKDCGIDYVQGHYVGRPMTDLSVPGIGEPHAVYCPAR